MVTEVLRKEHIHYRIYLSQSYLKWGSTPYVGLMWEEVAPHNKIVFHISAPNEVVIGLYKPYQSFSIVFISNQADSVARDHHWSTTLPRR